MVRKGTLRGAEFDGFEFVKKELEMMECVRNLKSSGRDEGGMTDNSTVERSR